MTRRASYAGPSLGGPPPTLFRRRRPRWPLLLGTGVLVVSALTVGAVFRHTAPSAAVAAERSRLELAAPGDRAPQLPPVALPAEVRLVLPQVFARIEGVELHLVNQNVVLTGFHEASYSDALAMTPAGDILANENTTKFRGGGDPDGPDELILSSRGRRQAATSAADLVIPDGSPVASPVTGTVVAVDGYALYGRYRDHRIEIAPDAAPHLRVVVIHVEEPAVRVGDRVEAGRTVVAATPNLFPFSSHIDRYTDPDRHPHVHIEVKRATDG